MALAIRTGIPVREWLAGDPWDLEIALALLLRDEES